MEKLLYSPAYFNLSHLADLLIINKADPVIKQSNSMTTKKIFHQRDSPRLHWGLYSYTLYIVIKKCAIWFPEAGQVRRGNEHWEKDPEIASKLCREKIRKAETEFSESSNLGEPLVQIQR